MKGEVVKIVPLLGKLYLEVAFLYLKEERSNTVIKAFIGYLENRGGNLINI
jgi:hypothetical protein